MDIRQQHTHTHTHTHTKDSCKTRNKKTELSDNFNMTKESFQNLLQRRGTQEEPGRRHELR